MVEEQEEGTGPSRRTGEGSTGPSPPTQGLSLPHSDTIELGQTPNPPLAIPSGEGTSRPRNPLLLVLRQLYRSIKDLDEETVNSTMAFFENSSTEELKRNIAEFKEMYAPPSRAHTLRASQLRGPPLPPNPHPHPRLHSTKTLPTLRTLGVPKRGQ